MYWTESFKNRVLFNASKAYVEQFDKEELKERVKELQKIGQGRDVFKEVPPVYSLNLLNVIFEKSPEMAEEYYHHYSVVNLKHTEKRIKGLELIFVELPKFKPSNKAERKFNEIWLRYLTEVSIDKNEVPADLLEIKETREAIELLERYTYTSAEMYEYDRAIDAVWVENALVEGAREEERAIANEKVAAAEEKAAAAEEKAVAAVAEAVAERAKTVAAQAAVDAERAKAAEEKRATARALKTAGVSAEVIAQSTGLAAAEIARL
jgi:hypothetical protein